MILSLLLVGLLTLRLDALITTYNPVHEHTLGRIAGSDNRSQQLIADLYSNSSSELRIYINSSPGGEYWEAHRIVNAIQYARSKNRKVSCVGQGLVASGAAFIFNECSERIFYPDTLYSVHCPFSLMEDGTTLIDRELCTEEVVRFSKLTGLALNTTAKLYLEDVLLTMDQLNLVIDPTGETRFIEPLKKDRD